MTRNNIRVPSSPSVEPYDPKTRAIGGIVLFLLMMLLYAVLKALLGISSTGAAYALRAPLPDEVKAAQAAMANAAPAAQAAKSKYPIINKFVFLDLNGKPMENGLGTIELAGMTNSSDSSSSTDTTFDGTDGKEWYVQAASFRELSRAREMQKKLKNNGFATKVLKIGDWYAVRLLPLASKGEATQQLRALRRMGIQGQRRQIK